MLITISRQFGAGGSAVARRVAERLGWQVVDNELVEAVAERVGLTPGEVAEREERAPSFLERLTRTLASQNPELFPPAGGTVQDLDEAALVRVTETVVAEVARKGKVVLVGRAAPAVVGQVEGCLHVKLVAARDVRVRAVCDRFGIEPDEARQRLEEKDAHRLRYHREYYNRDWNDPVNYHMVLNSGLLGLDGAADVIVAWADRGAGGGRAERP